MAWWIFQNVVITAALAAVVATVCRIGRIGPVGRHALWVLVLVKFVTPPLVVWPWAAPDPLGIAMLDVRPDRPVVSTGTVAPDPAVTSDDDDITTRQPGGYPAVAASDSRTVSQLGSAARPWLLALWAAGSLGLLGLEGVRLVRLARRVRSASPADPAIVRRVATLSTRLGLRPVPVVAMAGSASPVVWCLGRPRLLWPADLVPDPAGSTEPATSTEACIDGLLVHELAHVKRRDHLVGWIELVAGVLWWWNPLFWMVRSALREQAELACDAWVISALPNGRRAYAESLLALSSAAVSGTPSASMAAVVGVRARSRRSLERRLVMIMKGRAPLRLPWAGLLTLAVVAAATLPAWATADQQPPQTQQQAQQPRPQPQQGQLPQRQQQQHQPQQPPTPAIHHATSIPPQVHQVPTPAQSRPVRVHVATEVHPVVVQDGQRLRVEVTTPKPQVVVALLSDRSHLTDEGQKLVQGFETDRDAIQKEADLKVQARHDALVKELQALQDQYAKAGKLDEAIAIRDYLRAGGRVRFIKR